MSKRKITKQQQRQIASTQQRRIQSVTGTQQQGLVIARYGKKAMVEAGDTSIHQCALRQHLGYIVAGDQVVWHATQADEGVITALLPRKSELTKPITHNIFKPVAANINQVIIVVAPQPPLSTLLLDSYLVACHTLQLSPIILVNKYDLLSDDDDTTQAMKVYTRLPYPVLYTSTSTPHGLDHLHQTLQQHTSVFVGQSGVGKSSLIVSLLPHEDIVVGALSATQAHGRHTTSSSRLYHLPTGGDLIDSPGVREFGLWHMPAAQIAKGFVEFTPWLGKCKFSDCQHQQEPGCAIIQAMQQGDIHPARVANYHRLVAQYQR
jgi:ribosome biogenesis GTPase / thiamine phosphate phosphatase